MASDPKAAAWTAPKVSPLPLTTRPGWAAVPVSKAWGLCLGPVQFMLPHASSCWDLPGSLILGSGKT